MDTPPGAGQGPERGRGKREVRVSLAQRGVALPRGIGKAVATVEAAEPGQPIDCDQEQHRDDDDCQVHKSLLICQGRRAYAAASYAVVIIRPMFSGAKNSAPDTVPVNTPMKRSVSA